MIETKLHDATDVALRLLDQLVGDQVPQAMVDAVRDAGKVVRADAVTRIKAPGYPGDKPGLPPLSESIIVEVREYDSYTVAYVGASWPDGAHGHLVEFGHIQKVHGSMLSRKKRPASKHPDGAIMIVPPYPWLRPAAESTRAAQAAAIEARLTRAVG